MGAVDDLYVSHHADPDAVREEFAEIQQEKCAQYGSDTYAGHLGIKPGLEIINKVMPSVEDAEAYIIANNDKWEAAWAVPFRRAGKIPTAAGRKVMESRRALQNKIDGFRGDVVQRIKAAKSKTIGCKSCGSAVSRKFLRTCDCPVCGKKDAFLTTTDHKRLDSMCDRYSELRRREVPYKTGETVGYCVGGLCAS